MFRETVRSKKTLTNELNVPGSTDSRRLDQDIVPIIAPSFLLPPATSLSSAVTLGSAQNPWRNVHTESLFAAFPKVPAASAVSVAAPSGDPSSNGGVFWWWQTTPGRCFRWSGTAWVDYTDSLTPGAVWYVSGSTFFRFYVWSGPLDGGIGGLKVGFSSSDF